MRIWLLMFVASFGAAAQSIPPRDAPGARGAGTAIVRGRVIAAATNEPLHRVRVTLVGSAASTPPSAYTDTRGEFEITGVPAGTYRVSASRAGYLTVQYGQRRPREAGRTLEVRDGDVVERLDIALHRGGVLAGWIADDLGDPYPFVRVDAVEYMYLRGRRVPAPVAWTTTDDRGEFRLGGLAPGTYVLRASSVETWSSDDGATAHAYARTYFPGVAALDQAQRVSFSAGETLASLNFRLIAGRAARIRGVMRDANGEPMALQAISLDRATRGANGGLFALSRGATPARTDANGSFAFDGLAPGEYVVYSGSDAEGARVSVVVEEGDARSVVLTPRKPSAIAGAIVTDEGTAPPFPPTRLRVTPVDADPRATRPSFTGPRATTVGRDWTFRVEALDGAYLFRVDGLPDGWMLKAVRIEGGDVTDAPLNVPAGGADRTGLQIVLSRHGGRVDGRAVDRRDAPAADSTVVIFAADPAKWTLASRFVKTARPDGDGRFSIAGLPPGAYRAIARDFVADGQWEDPEFLTSVARDSVRFELAEHGSETLTLKLEPPR